MKLFDKKAPTWDDNPVRTKYSMAIANYIKEHTDEGTHQFALEVGAGTGTISFMLANTFNIIDMLDGSIGMIQQMEEKLVNHHHKNLRPIHMDYEDYIAKEHYDVLYSSMFLHHTKHIDHTLRKLSELVKVGGKVFLCDLYTEDGRFHSDSAEGVYHHGFDPDHVANILKTKGFTINNIETIFNFDKNDRLYPMFLVEATKIESE